MIALILTAVLAAAPTPPFLPVIAEDGYTCPGGTMADGSVRPGDGFTPAGMTCVAISVRMVEIELT